MLMGLKPCMSMETHFIATLHNYGKVGFWFDIGNELVPLMHLGFRGSPNFFLAHVGLVFSFCHLGFGIGST